MAGFIVRRLISAFLVIALTSMIVFGLFAVGPADPARPLCEAQGRCTPEKLANIEHSLGLDKSVVSQYGTFIKGVFVGRTIQMGGATYECPAPCFGISYKTRTPVTEDLVKKYPATLSIAIGGAMIYLLVGVTSGALAARWRGTAADRLLVSSTLVMSSVPYYLVALLAWLFLTLRWPIFPKSEYVPFTESPSGWFAGLLLAWLVLGITNSTQYARFTRGQMVETIGEDYIRSATAKGVRSNRVIFKHALRAAIVPIVTIFGLDFAALLAGTVFTEKIFDINGVGLWAIDSIRSPTDLPVVTATVLLSATLVVIANLVVDIVYGFLDPRVRVS